MSILRYRRSDGAGVSLSQINRNTGGVVQSVTAPSPGMVVDLDVTGSVEDVDEYMATLGFTKVATDPSDSIELAGASEVPGVNAGGTPLIMGAISDGQVMSRQGDNIIGVASSGDTPSLQVENTTDLVLSNSFQAVTWDQVDFQNDSSIIARDAVNQERINFLQAGVYRIQFSLDVIIGQNDDAEIRALKNGTTPVPGSLTPFSVGQGGGVVAVTRSLIISVAKDDYITVEAREIVGAGTVQANSVFTAQKSEEGAQGPPLPAQDQAKIDLTTEGSCKIMYPIDAGIRSPSTQVDPGTNNNMPALKFLVGQDGQSRWSVAAPKNRTTGDVTMRLYGSIVSTANADTVWEFGYNFLNVGDNLGSYTTQSVTRDMQPIAVDELFTIELVMPAADFDANSDILFLRVARMGTNPSDTYTGDVWIHGFELEYTGWRVAGQPLGA